MQAAMQSLGRNKSFVYLMTAQAVSNLGDWLDVLAILALMALKWNAAPVEMAMVMLSLAVPITVLGPVTGVFADRMERKTLMIVSDIARAILVVSLVLVTSIWQVYVILIVRGVFEALFTPAKNGKLKEIIPDEQMEKATMISTVIDQAAKILGPVLGGALLAVMDISVAFYLDAASFILSALLLLGVQRGRQPRAAADELHKRSIMHELKAGMQFVLRVPVLMFGTVLFTFAMLVLQIADSQIMIFFRELTAASTGLIGSAMAASGLGMIVSAGIVSQKPIKSPLSLMAIGCMVIGLVYAIVAFGQDLAVNAWIWFPGLFFIGGAAAGIVFIPFQAGAQRRTPVELSGRVFGTISSVSTAAVIIGPMVGALLVTKYGVISAFESAGTSLAIIGMLALLLRKNVERKDELVTESNRVVQGTTAA